MKLLSVITINYNNKAGLEKTIASVVSQNTKELEFIIIDGGSTDGSVDVIKSNEKNISFWCSEKDNGIYHAQNKGIAKANGEYCLFLNSGDVFASDDVANTILPQLKEADIVYGDLITNDEKGVKESLSSPDVLDVPQFMVSTLWHPTAFIKRALFSRCGTYNESFKITGDYEFFIRSILKNNASTKHISIPISIFDLGGISNSSGTEAQHDLERKKSWQVNYSQPEIEAFEKYTQILRSREYKIGKLVNKFFKPFKK